MVSPETKEYCKMKREEYMDKNGIKNAEELDEHLYNKNRNQILKIEKNIESMIKNW
jgi:hypothetical protein